MRPGVRRCSACERFCDEDFGDFASKYVDFYNSYYARWLCDECMDELILNPPRRKNSDDDDAAKEKETTDG